MAENSKIEWTDHTFNPWIGCTKVSDGCRNCYAETMMDTRYGRVAWGKGKLRQLTSESNWRLPLTWDRKAKAEGRRRRVFCASLADVFDAEVPDKWRDALMVLIHATPNLDWLLLTKRPEVALRYLTKEREKEIIRWRDIALYRATAESAWPLSESAARRSVERGISHFPNWPNIWIGTSVENQAAADERIPILIRVPARVRFLSCEPLLGPIDLFAIPRNDDAYFRWRGETGVIGRKDEPDDYVYWQKHGLIHLVITGGESGPKARPSHPDWFKSLRDQCVAAGVAYHHKQNGEWISILNRDADDPDWRADYAKFGKSSRHCYINVDGGSGFHGERLHVMERVGKKAAGRELDGRTWDEMPEVANG